MQQFNAHFIRIEIPGRFQTMKSTDTEADAVENIRRFFDSDRVEARWQGKIDTEGASVSVYEFPDSGDQFNAVSSQAVLTREDHHGIWAVFANDFSPIRTSRVG